MSPFAALIDKWRRLYWLTRLSMLGTFAAALWWQARYTSWFLCPQYGWPFSFEYLWDRHRGRHLSMLVIDCTLWLMLAAATGFLADRWRRRSNPFRLTPFNVVALLAVLAALSAVGGTEAYFRSHPNNNMMCPKYAHWDGVNVWLDIGLFTDPLYQWPLPRLVLIGSIGCVLYAAGEVLCRFVRLGCRRLAVIEDNEVGRSPDQMTDEAPPQSDGDPTIIRVVIWLTCIFDTLYLVWLIIPPVVIT